jgi:polyhydroxyalkanoate synthesis regulator protein
MKVLRKYSNRKIYDVEQSKYVNHPEIATMLKKGIEVQVVDHENGKDITNNVLKSLLHSVKVKNEDLISLITVSRGV